MSNEKAELLVIIAALIIIVMGVLFLATTPFAFLGWLVLSFIDIFTTVAITYFNCTITGLFIAITAGLLSK